MNIPTKGSRAGIKLGPRQIKPVPADARWLSGKQVRDRYGGKSEMWLFRKLRDDPDFPRPRYSGHLKIFSVDQLDEYERNLATVSPAKKAKA
jgi:hypothetical protein